jgi:hypothetical protein
MPTTPALTTILELEEQLQAAWRTGDRAGAADIRARPAKLWERRRAELAELSKRTPSRWDGMTFSVRRGA